MYRLNLLPLLALFTLLATGPATAAPAPASASASVAVGHGLRFEHIGTDQGLPQESVLTVLQDRLGFMWFGTQAGLVRFDGYRAKVFRNDPRDVDSLVDNYVLCSHEDGAGRLWFGTRGGLVRLH
jgi:ligand-binding sensor domain-containing protein